jgi:hypothetical protein
MQVANSRRPILGKNIQHIVLIKLKRHACFLNNQGNTQARQLSDKTMRNSSTYLSTGFVDN